MPGRIAITSFFILCCLLSKAQFEQAFHSPIPERLKKIDTAYIPILKSGNQDMQRKAVLNIQQLAKQNNDDQSALLAEIFRWRIDIQADSNKLTAAVKRLQEIVHNAQSKSYYHLEVYALVWLGDFLREHNRGGAALSYYYEAYKLFDKTGDKLIPKSVTGTEYDIALALYSIGAWERTRDFLLGSHILKSRNHQGMLALDMLSQLYLKLGSFDSSAQCIDKALDIYLLSDTTSWYFRGWRGIFLGNLGKIEYAKKNYAAAIPLLQTGISITAANKLYDNVCTLSLLLADCFLQTGQKVEAKKQIPVISGIIHENPLQQNYIDYYRLQITLGMHADDPAKTKMILDSLDYWKARQTESADQNSVLRIEMEIETKNFRERTKSLENSIRKQENIRIILLSLLGIAVLVSALIIYRKQYELSRQRRESEITMAELELFKNSLVEKSRQIEALENSHEKNATLEALRDNTILTEAEWDHFKTLFEKAHQGFFNRLKKQIPELTPGEIRLISLTKLNLTNKEMASTLGVGAGAIRTMKSRLMKKLNLPENETLEEIIDEL